MSSMFDFCVDTYADMQGIYHTRDWKDPRCAKLLKECQEYVLSHSDVSEREFWKIWHRAVEWYDEMVL